MEEKASEEIRWIEVKNRRRGAGRGLGSRIYCFSIMILIAALFLCGLYLVWERVRDKHLISRSVFPQEQEQIVALKDEP